MTADDDQRRRAALVFQISAKVEHHAAPRREPPPSLTQEEFRAQREEYARVIDDVLVSLPVERLEDMLALDGDRLSEAIAAAMADGSDEVWHRWLEVRDRRG